MRKYIYTSGFLYHPASQQILLQQTTSPVHIAQWTLLHGLGNQEEDPDNVFKKTISELLDVRLASVLPIYSYLNEGVSKSQFIFYSEIEKLQEFPSKNDVIFTWFSFKNVLKLNITEQTKHDIVVGKRVIEAAERRRLGQHTF